MKNFTDKALVPWNPLAYETGHDKECGIALVRDGARAAINQFDSVRAVWIELVDIEPLVNWIDWIDQIRSEVD